MILARVTGRITSTIHHPDMEGQRLLVLDKLDPAGEPTGGYVIAVDSVGAGAGETVIVLDEGNGARQILGGAEMPVRSVVVGIVDHLPID
ncbi:MAG: EutN/CcmL family microcompartment protein [Candidatus Krumholzibacteriota bacterium]